MSKTLLVGPAGCGKTHAVLEAFEKSLRSGCPLDPDTFFVVPSAEHTDRIVSLLVQRGIAGFFYKRVTTLSRLIHSSFPLPDIPVASNFVRASIVRELLQENGWEYFERLKDSPD